MTSSHKDVVLREEVRRRELVEVGHDAAELRLLNAEPERQGPPDRLPGRGRQHLALGPDRLRSVHVRISG